MSQKLYHRFSAKLYVYHGMTLSSHLNLLAANVLYTSCYYATFYYILSANRVCIILIVFLCHIYQLVCFRII